LSIPLGKLYVVDQIGQANPAIPTAGEEIVIDYCLIGEELGAPELV
jgi:hypothetical protein